MCNYFPSIIVLTLLLLLPCGRSGYADETMDAVHLPVGTLTISAPRGVAPRRAPVAFPHSRHFDYACKTCHHHWDSHSQVSSCTASGCHDLISLKKGKSDAPSNPDERMYFKTAYHKRCIQCHKSLKIKREALEKSRIALTQPLPRTGPTGCIGCHPKH